MEMDYNRNGECNFKSTRTKIKWNGTELECNWNGNFSTKEIDAEQIGNGMDLE